MKPWWAKMSFFSGMLLTAIAVMVPFTPSLSGLSSLPDNERIIISGSTFPGNSSLIVPDKEPAANPLVIPLKQAGRLFLIDAKVDDVTGNLVFDTGAKGLVLNSTYFRDHPSARNINSAGITGDVGNTRQITAGKVEFSELVFTKLTAETVNLGHIENRRGIKILGLMGFGMLRNFEIVIDPVHSELRLYKIDRTGKRIDNQSGEFKPDLSQEIEGSGNILFLKGMICGKALKFCFDTAAETNVLSSSSNRSVLSTLTITRRTELKGAGSAVSEVLFGRMNDFTMGDRTITGMETVVTNLTSLLEAYNTHIDGILGYSFLQHTVVCVNFMNSHVGILFAGGEEK